MVGMRLVSTSAKSVLPAEEFSVPATMTPPAEVPVQPDTSAPAERGTVAEATVTGAREQFTRSARQAVVDPQEAAIPSTAAQFLRNLDEPAGVETRKEARWFLTTLMTNHPEQLADLRQDPEGFLANTYPELSEAARNDVANGLRSVDSGMSDAGFAKKVEGMGCKGAGPWMGCGICRACDGGADGWDPGDC